MALAGAGLTFVLMAADPPPARERRHRGMRETLRLVSEHHLDEGNRLDDMLLEIGRVGHVALRKLLLREGHSLEKAKEYGASPKYM